MTWGNAQALWLLALVPVLVLLFLHRHRTASVTVPSLLFWQEHGRPADGPPLGLPLQKLLNLLVQILLLCLLVFSLANPGIQIRPREHFVLVLDASATMQTVSPGGSSRMQEALSRAEQLVGAMPDDTLFTVIRAAAFPQVVLKATPDKSAVRAVLSSITAEDADSDLHEAVRLAQTLDVAGWRTRIVCMSDCVGTPADLLSNRDGSVSVERIGIDSPNAGIVRLALAEDHSGLDIAVGQHGLTGQTVTLTLATGKKRLAQQTVQLQQAVTNVRVPVSLTPGMVFSVQLDPVDSLALDNVAWGVWPEQARLRIRLVTRGNLYLEQALAAGPGAELQVTHPDQWNRTVAADVTVLDGMPLATVAATPGKFLVFPPGRPTSASQPSVALSVTQWVADHPALRNVDPSLWRIRRTAGLQPPGARVLVTAPGTPLMYEWNGTMRDGQTQAGGSGIRSIVFDFNLTDTDLALSPAFPVLLWDAIDYLVGSSRTEGRVCQRTAQLLKIPAIDGSPKVPLLQPPVGSSGPMLRQGAEWVWPNMGKQGIYSVQGMEQGQVVAANWLSLRSSMPCRAAALTQLVPKVEQGATAWLRLPWQVLLTLAATAAVAEWLLFQRRILDMRQE